MLDEKEVKKVAELARLKLKSQEVQKLRKDLAKILDYIEKLKELDVSKVKPTSHSVELFNVERKDKTKSQPAEKLIELFPEKKDRFLKVKSVFKKS